ncbi:AI-2E family transporter [Sedimentibacter sp. zth1]|uniref:AI-2E family transporter n=1 Tax=Sedimentibacter sp. zth1 TaxID=2816908 RepID=UPI001A922E47|nr:AI-2E family transporter [Sedimentibacter sp. zth1]QSX07138.1 AI-2E family transporter [Sedimentibacter sp. zth1]
MNNTKNLCKTVLPIILVSLFGLLVIFRPEVIVFLLNVSKPLIISFAIAYLLDSLVRALIKKFKIRRIQAILLSCILLIGIISLIISVLIPKVIDNANAVVNFVINSSKEDFNSMLEEVIGKIDNEYLIEMANDALKLSEDIKVKINELIKFISNFLLNSVTTIGSSILTIVTSFILALYMLIEKEDLIARAKRLVYAFFPERKSEFVFETATNANRIFKSYLVGKLIDSLIVGVISIIVFSIFKVPYAPLMGSIIGIFNLIPYFGPIIGAVPVVVVCFIISPSKALTALIIIIIIGQLDGNFIDPKIVGNNVGVSPFWVVSAVIVGGSMLGPVGMILGVPSVVLIKTIIEDTIKARLREKNMENFQLENIKNIDIKK